MSIVEKKVTNFDSNQTNKKEKKLINQPNGIISLNNTEILSTIERSFDQFSNKKMNKEKSLLSQLEIKEIKITKKEIIVIYKHNEIKFYNICVFKRKIKTTNEEIKVNYSITLSNQIIFLHFPIRYLYYLHWNKENNKINLFCWIWNQSQQEILQNLILYGKSEISQKLCQLNHWKEEELPLYSIHLGIQHKQIENIPFSLQSLNETQWRPALTEICKFLFLNINLYHNDEFYKELLKLTQKFLINILNTIHNKLLNQNKQEKSFLANCNKNNDVITETSKIFTKKKGKLHKECPSYFKYFYQEFNLLDENSLLFFSNILRILRNISNLKPLKKENSSNQLLVRDQNDNFNHYLSKLLVVDQNKYLQMSDIDIINDALLTGNISNALQYLSIQLNENKLIPWNQFLNISFSIIYQTITRFQFDDAYIKLLHIGMNPLDSFLQILLFTSRRKLRNDLFLYMKRKFSFFDKDINLLIERDLKLISLYPNPYYALEFIKKQAIELKNELQLEFEVNLFSNPSYNSKEKIICKDLADFPQNISQSYQIEFQFNPAVLLFMNDSDSDNENHENHENLNSEKIIHGIPLKNGPNVLKIEAITDNSYSDENHSGYAHYSLSWIKKWGNLLYELILIDQNELKYFSISSLQTQFIYIITHDKINLLHEFINHFFNTFKDLKEQKEIIIHKDQLINKIGNDFYDLFLKYLSKASPSLCESILNSFSCYGIFFFLIDNEFLNLYHSDFPLLYQRSKSNLFLNHDKNINNSINQYSLFDLNFIHKKTLYELEKLNISYFIHEYISSFQLFKNVTKNKFLQINNNEHHFSLWFKLLCYLQNPTNKNVYKASFINSMIILYPDVIDDYENNNYYSLLIKKMIEDHKISMLLGFIIYSGKSFDEFFKFYNIHNNQILINDFNDQILSFSNSLSNQLSKKIILNYDFKNDSYFYEIWPRMWQLFISSSSFQHNHSLNLIINSFIEENIKQQLILKDNHDKTKNNLIDNFFYYLNLKNNEISIKDHLDIEYFLISNQPFMAYQYYKLNDDDDDNSSSSSSSSTVKIWKILLQNLHNNSIVSSCLIFLELCEENTGYFKINIFVIRRILAFLGKKQKQNNSNSNGPFGCSFHIFMKIFDMCLFLADPSFISSSNSITENSDDDPTTDDNDDNDDSIDEILNLACEATDELSSQWFEEFECFLDSSTNKWELICRFCQIHELNFPINHLENLLHQNEISLVIYYSQIYELSQKKLEKLLKKQNNQNNQLNLSYFQFILKNNKNKQMLSLLNESKNEIQIKIENQFELNEKKSNVIENLFEHLTMLTKKSIKDETFAGLFYLQKAFQFEQKLFLLFADLYKIQWEILFFSNLYLSFSSYLEISEQEKFQNQIQFCFFTNGKETLLGGENDLKFYEIFNDLMIHLLSTIGILPLIHSISIFNNNSNGGLLLLFLFYRDFTLLKFKNAENYLKSFQNQNHKSWLWNLCDIILNKILSSCKDNFERKKLLSITYRQKCGDIWKKRYSIFVVLEKCNLKASFDSDIHDIVSLLLDHDKFVIAKDFCDEHQISSSRVVISECYSFLKKCERRQIWSNEAERKVIFFLLL